MTEENDPFNGRNLPSWLKAYGRRMVVEGAFMIGLLVLAYFVLGLVGWR